MSIHDKYRMIRTNGTIRKIEAAVDKVKGSRELPVKDFLPK